MQGTIAERRGCQKRGDTKCLKSASPANQAIYRLMLEVGPRLEDSGMQVLHSVPQLHTESAKDVSLPCVLFCVYSRLDMFVVDHASPEGFLCL